MKKKSISIVIPVYNEAAYIEECLFSLEKQTLKPLEIIVVDNNCTDRTIDIVKKFKGIKVLKESEQGITPARNSGFDKARGDIIVKIDADARVNKDFLKKIRTDFIQHPKIAGVTVYVKFYDTLMFRRIKAYYDVYMMFAKATIGHFIFGGPTYAISKEFWLKVKDQICLNDKIVHEDIDLSIHVGKLGGEIYFDKSLMTLASGRRIKYNPLSFFLEYPARFVKMLESHRPH